MADSIHLHGQIIGRSAGRSATAAAAYRTGLRIVDERTGEIHDYRRRGGVVLSETLVPEHAPDYLADASTLWNAVELAERGANAQLAREMDIALPRELSWRQNYALARSYVSMFVDEGMCVTWAYHDPDEANENPHIHVMLTMREVREDGTFAPKSHKEYLCRNNQGGERYMAGNQLEAAEGWEKVYTYRRGNERRELTPTEAEGWKGCKRQGKAPVDRKVAANDWSSPEKMEEWRERWAGLLNEVMEITGVDKEYDHRSFVRRGIEQVPQVHLGHSAAAMEERGIETARGEQNRAIAEINGHLQDEELPREVRQEALEKGYEISAAHFESAEEVREVAHPILSRLREAALRVAEAARELVERAREAVYAATHREHTAEAVPQQQGGIAGLYSNVQEAQSKRETPVERRDRIMAEMETYRRIRDGEASIADCFEYAASQARAAEGVLRKRDTLPILNAHDMRELENERARIARQVEGIRPGYDRAKQELADAQTALGSAEKALAEAGMFGKGKAKRAVEAARSRMDAASRDFASFERSMKPYKDALAPISAQLEGHKDAQLEYAKLTNEANSFMREVDFALRRVPAEERGAVREELSLRYPQTMREHDRLERSNAVRLARNHEQSWDMER